MVSIAPLIVNINLDLEIGSLKRDYSGTDTNCTSKSEKRESGLNAQIKTSRSPRITTPSSNAERFCNSKNLEIEKPNSSKKIIDYLR